jgi:plasmid replication initiation protein
MDVTVMGKTESTHKKELKKHTAAIHSMTTLSLLQRKISNALLFYAYHELKEKEEHQITIKELCRIIGYQGNNHAAIKDALRGLISTIIEWNVINEDCGREDWTASTIIASVHIEGPTCYYAYSPRMKELLYSPLVYGKINLIVQSRFRSNYGLALYENCVRYKNLPSTKWFDYETFRLLMGVPKDKYGLFRDFKRRVLDKSVEEVNAYSDLVVEAEIQKENRKASKIRFKLKERGKRGRIGKNASDQGLHLTAEQKELIEKMKSHYGFTRHQAIDLINEFGQPLVEEKMALIEQTKSYKKGEIQSMAAYFLSALRGDFQPVVNSHQANRDREHIKQQQQLMHQKQRDLDETLDNQYTLYQTEQIETFFNGLSPQKQRDIEQAFSQGLIQAKNTVIHKLYKQAGLGNVLVRSVFRGFIREHYYKTGLMSFEAFKQGVTTSIESLK